MIVTQYNMMTCDNYSDGDYDNNDNTANILEEEIKKLKSKQIEGNQDLAGIKYATNMFETAMGKLTYGGAEKEG